MPAPTAGADSGAVTIVIQLAAGVGQCPARALLRQWINGALAAADAVPAGSELTLRIVDEAESAALNERYRGRAYPTNVLSFRPADDWPAIPGEVMPLGDLVVCAPIIRQEAVAGRKPIEAHWAHIVVHGTLHLLGYDHEAPVQAEKMEAAERRILMRLGFPDPYSEPAGAAD